MGSPANPAMRARHRKLVSTAARFARQLWWLDKTRAFRSSEEQKKKQSQLYARQAREFTELAMKMGGLIIKLGQHYSARADILPKEYIGELTRLQDRVTPEQPEAIVKVIEAEFGQALETRYASFDPEPIAAASLGQVHRARLHDGAEVAVKVLRPGIEAIIESDFRSLKTILNLLKRLTPYSDLMDFDEFYREFTSTISAELDYIQEGHNAETFQESLLLNPNVEIPKIYWDLTSRRVLTMEYLEGIKIDDLLALDAEGIDRHELAINLLEIYLQMILLDGFYHADPHSGNIFVERQKNQRGRIILLDFGMVGTLPELTRDSFANFVQALIANDVTAMVELLQTLGFIRKDADTTALHRALGPLLQRVISTRGNTKTPMSEGLASDLQELVYEQPFLFPAGITFLGKALIMLFAQCSHLDPDMDVFAEASDLLKTTGLFGESEADSLFGLDTKSLLRDSLLPALLRFVSLSEKLNKGELVVRLSRTQEKRIAGSIAAQTKSLTETIIGASFFIAGIVLLTGSDTPVVAVALLCVGLITMLLQLRSPKRGRKP
jgi:predicted unusual protein kinase regulating ubiquinone biosynthesis (AarF/ABC1/UbiB family)